MAHIIRLFKGDAVVALRGTGIVADEAKLKVWMRSSVLASQAIVWTPAVLLWVYVVLNGAGGASKRSGRTKLVALLTIMLHPATILIDNGHFQ
jgi:alpha-1,3-glucosyltransferase